MLQLNPSLSRPARMGGRQRELLFRLNVLIEAPDTGNGTD